MTAKMGQNPRLSGGEIHDNKIVMSNCNGISCLAVHDSIFMYAPLSDSVCQHMM